MSTVSLITRCPRHARLERATKVLLVNVDGVICAHADTCPHLRTRPHGLLSPEANVLFTPPDVNFKILPLPDALTWRLPTGSR